MTNDEIYTAVGKHLGYPDCCIKGFLHIYKTGGVEPRKLNGTGFVPCLECNKLSTEELLDTINKNRRSNVKFPHADFSKEAKKLGLG